MKKLVLEQKLIELGCKFHRHGSKHDIWVYANGRKFPFPRHPNINERTATSMIEKARKNTEV